MQHATWWRSPNSPRFPRAVRPSVAAGGKRGELVALARAKPGQLAHAAGGGSFADAVTGALGRSADIRFARVPLAAGQHPVDALLSGHAWLGFEPLYPRLEDMRHKRLRALAVDTSRRVDAAPALPTFAEAGLGEFLASPWLGLFAPSGTPDEVMAKLYSATRAALERREVRSLFERAGLEPALAPREKFSFQVRDDIVRFGWPRSDAQGRAGFQPPGVTRPAPSVTLRQRQGAT